MNTPGFTAEATLSKMMDNYALTLRDASVSSGILPQFCIGNMCCNCWSEAGFSGCLCHRRPVFSVGFGSPVER